jgi:AAA domain
MKQQAPKQYVVKGFDGRSEMYAHIAGSEWHDNSCTLVIGDTSDDLWWKKVLKDENANGEVSERATQLSLKHIPPVKTKRGGEIPFSLAHTEQARKLITVLRDSWESDSPITRLALYLQAEQQKTQLPMVLERFPDLVVYHVDAEWYDYQPTDDDEECLVSLGDDPAKIWDTQSEVEQEKDLPWLIEGIAHDGESTWFGGLPKAGKTWVMLCVLLALLNCTPLFGDDRLKVPRKAKRCVYLCPEAGRGSIKKRLKMLGLIEHLYDPITNPEGRLYLQTLSKGRKIALTDPLLLELAKGADIFVDTAVRYLEGDENSVKDVRVLTENILNLLAVGARSVWVAHHAPKGFENASTMSLQNMFRGSGEFGAALTNAYGVCTEEEATTKLRFHSIVGRDLDQLIPDMILQGRPWLSETGNFKVVETNAAPFNRKAGAPGDSKKQQKIDFARGVEGSMQEKADAVNTHFGTKHSRSTIYEWLKETSSFDVEVSHE